MSATNNNLAKTLPDRASRVSLRTICFVVVSAVLAVACLLFTVQYFVGERVPELTEQTLREAMKRWDEQGPAGYDLDVELRGARPGNVHVEVRDRKVVAETRDGKIPGAWTWETWTVPGMFDTLSLDLQTAENPEQQIQAAEGTKWRLRCEFDPVNGLPRIYHRIVTSGPEVYWQVSNYQPK